MFLSSIWYSNENVDVPDDFLSPRIYREWNNSVLFMLCGPTNAVQESVGFIPFETNTMFIEKRHRRNMD
jgi:hypothetical protein